VYSKHHWIASKFVHHHPNFMQDSQDKRVLKGNYDRHFFDRLAVKLGYKCMEDWYNTTAEEIHKNGGSRRFYRSSPAPILQKVYPHHQWMTWRFKILPKGYWQSLKKDSQETLKMMEWLAKELTIKSLDEWCRVSLQQLTRWVRIESSNELVELLHIA